MALTVFATSEASEKVINGEKKTLTPMAVDDGLSMGVGVADNHGEALIWGLAHPKLPIASWRGMEIAGRVSQIEHDTLSNCWYAGQRNPHTSDRDGISKIETEIGAKTRQEILDRVPENMDDILTLLKERDVNFCGWELEQEVENGALPATPKVQECIGEYHREQELHEAEKYGRLLPVDEALRSIAEDQFSPTMQRTAQIFVDTFKQHVDQEHMIGICRADFGFRQHYAIAKLKADPSVEVTLMFSMVDTFIRGFSCTLKIGLQRDGTDIEFQPQRPKPTVLQQISENSIVRSLGLSPALKRMAEHYSHEPSLEEKFPLHSREHGAVLSPAGSTKNPRLHMELRDPGLPVESLKTDLERALAEGARTASDET